MKIEEAITNDITKIERYGKILNYGIGVFLGVVTIAFSGIFLFIVFGSIDE